MQFPDPLGPYDDDGNPDPDAELFCNASTTLAEVDLRSVEFKLDPVWKAIDNDLMPPAPVSAQGVAQDAYDLFVCEPISSDTGSAEWKLTAVRALQQATWDCADKLVDEGCAPGGSPSDGQGQTGIGAEDVCRSFLTFPLATRLDLSTYLLESVGYEDRLINPAITLCDTMPLDESCFSGADSSSGG